MPNEILMFTLYFFFRRKIPNYVVNKQLREMSPAQDRTQNYIGRIN